MKTKEMIEWLGGKRTNDYDDEYNVPDDDLRAIAKIVARLKHYDTLCTKIEKLLDLTNNLFVTSNCGK